jgi:Ni/Fe-hydrogenase subunit HybB-like protein
MEKSSALRVRKDSQKIFSFIKEEFKPKGKLITPFNIIAAIIIVVGVGLIILRFAAGIGSVTNLSQEFPWGIWIGFDVVTGVAFAGGAYVLTFMVYILRLEKYHPVVRATVLNGFLAYVFYAGALLLDLGRPWNVINPIIGNKFGLSSVMFLVAWHFMLYMMAEFIEFAPAAAEWLGLKRMKKILNGLTIGAVIFGITLSTLHQSGLGALFLMAKNKIHPLWYSEFIPILFFVSSIFAGLSMVIFEGTISHKVFHNLLGRKMKNSENTILTGLGRVCAGAMFVYLFVQGVVFIHGQRWEYLNSGWGLWYLLEMIGFVAIPGVLFTLAVRNQNIKMIRIASVLALLGIVLNRLNVSVIAFKWYAPNHYYPSWQEIWITLTVIFAEIIIFRWIANRMPIFSDVEEDEDNEKLKYIVYDEDKEEAEKWKISNM